MSGPPAVARTALLLLPVQIVLRSGELLFPLLLAAWFGRTDETDLFFLLWAYFTFAGALLSSGFHDSALMPVLIELDRREPDLFPAVAGSVLGHLLVFGPVLAAVLGGAAIAAAWLFVEGPMLGLAVALVLLFSCFLVALTLRTFLVGLLNVRSWYFAYPVSSGLGILVCLIFVGLARFRLGILAVPTGMLLGELMAAALLAGLALGPAAIRLRLSLARSEPIRRLAGLLGSEVAGTTVTRINPFIDQLFAGFVSIVGGGTLLRYATDVASVPNSLAQATVLTVLLSHLSHSVADRSLERFEQTLRRSLLTVCALLTAASLALFWLRVPLLRLAFLHGSMDASGVERMAAILPWALVGVPPFGALLILARAHVALQNSRIMVSMGLLNAGLNVLLNALLVGPLGLAGIALSTSLVHLVVAVVFWVRLKIRLSDPAGLVPGAPAGLPPS